MNCLRCGYCCCNMMVIIVDDPDKGLKESNLIAHLGEGKPCKHLTGNKPGDYGCDIHDRPWFKLTPCSKHSQIERTNSDCRMGAFVLSKGLSVITE